MEKTIFITHKPLGRTGRLVWESWTELYAILKRTDEVIVTAFIAADHSTLKGYVTARYRNGEHVETLRDEIELKG